MRALVAAEALSVALFLGTAVWAVWDVAPPLPSIDVAALATGPAEERWMGIFMEDQHIGYAMARDAPTADGGRVYEERSSVRINAMGNVQDVLTAGTALVGPDGVLRSFDFVLSSPVKVFARGELHGLRLLLEITQGGSTQNIDLAVKEPPTLAMTLPALLEGRLTPGAAFSVPYFNPLTLSNEDAQVRVEDLEVLPNGETGWWVSTTYGGSATRRLVDAQGQTIREEGAMGLRLQRMTEAEATAVDHGTPPDLVALAAAPLDGTLPNAGNTHIVTVEVRGVEAARFLHAPPLQTVTGNTLTVSVPLLAELPELPVKGEGNLEVTLSLPVDEPEIRTRAAAVVGDAPNRLEAVRRINSFVHDYLKKVPTIGVPNGLEVLRAGEGDCNEHTALFVSLARAAGIPSRIAAGLVWSSRMGDNFYYHAWPEVQLGGPTDWVPVDPTFGQFPADATHLKVVNGDLDKQIEIMGMMGKVSFRLVEAR